MRKPEGQGQAYWRSLEELASTEAFQEQLAREFPPLASEFTDPLGRRRFLQLMGASIALAGLTGCTRQPAESIMPYVDQPENILPGKPLYYATAMAHDGGAAGLLVETHEGRPTKVEGNPQHPASLGATSAMAQAAILGLYDPDRSQTLTFAGEIRPWATFLATLNSALATQEALAGAGLRVLTGSILSPTLADQLTRMFERFPQARWHRYDPVSRDNARGGSEIAFGSPFNTIQRLDRADVVLSLDADLFGEGPAQLRHIRDYTERRTLTAGGAGMNRMYVAESSPTLTGARADHRLLLRPAEVEQMAHAVARALGVIQGRADTPHAEWVDAVVAELRTHRGKSLVVAGDAQPPAVHAMAHAINASLGNVGSTVIYTDPVDASPSRPGTLAELVDDMNSGSTDLLLILGGNPVYDAPADLGFGDALMQVPLRVHLSLYNDETSELCQWHVPQTHFLESWSDARAYDGTVSIQQPMIAPLYNGRSAHELLGAMTSGPGTSAHDTVRGYWQRQHSGGEAFDAFWRRSLHDGVVAGTAFRGRRPGVNAAAVARAAAEQPAAPTADSLDVVFRADPCVFDGCFANNGWLQELPKPLTKLTWDNAAIMSIATAERLGVERDFSFRGGEHGEAIADVVELDYDGRTIEAPVWIVPDHPDDTVTLHLGYGRRRAGRVGTGAGFDANALRTSRAMWSGSGLQVRATGERFSLANTQGHWNLEGRDLLRSGSREQYRRDPSLAPPHHHEIPETQTMYEPHEYPGYAWGMSIDLNSCMGCNACVVACQAENNIPVVGKDQVAAGREMHWLRADRYYKGDPEHPNDLETYFQPVPCQQCENAPCEIVCPVGATVHSAEGLNDMVYNRCVGTRYCANNCPYKVRRFNFFLYQDWETPSLKLLRNPDVTVRSRGVMEKCTYCVQRINRAKIQAELEDRTVRDSDVQTACQQACPAKAITFGDINNPGSQVAQEKSDDRTYSLLPHLNARPRTTYMGVVKNWNPNLHHDDDEGSASGHGHGS